MRLLIVGVSLGTVESWNLMGSVSGLGEGEVRWRASMRGCDCSMMVPCLFKLVILGLIAGRCHCFD